jgi:hypothetical protein
MSHGAKKYIAVKFTLLGFECFLGYLPVAPMAVLKVPGWHGVHETELPPPL